VRKTQVCTPVTSSDWQNAQFGDDDGSTDSSCNFLGGLDTETNVSFRVTNDNDSLESGTLTGTSLLLNGLDLQEEELSVSALRSSAILQCAQLREICIPS